MPSRIVNPFLRQRFYNQSSQANWRAFAAHREQITSRLEALAPTPDVSQPSVCILGAGNCNDLDLPRLSARWEHIQLVDIDAEAMQAGVANQFHTAPGAARLHQQRIGFTACDLTGALEMCHEITQFPSPQGFARLRAALVQLPALTHLPKQYSTVASTCLLSQLLEIFQRAIGETSPEFRAVAELIRRQHLRTLASLTAPGGTALLFADFVSSESHPELLEASPEALPEIMDRVLRERRCFPGMNPASICRVLSEAPLASYWQGPPTMSPPWVWNLGPRSYLVTAITCRRARRDEPWLRGSN